jgi:hypothetical protein
LGFALPSGKRSKQTNEAPQQVLIGGNIQPWIAPSLVLPPENRGPESFMMKAPLIQSS